jgi:hypothetical protein
VTVSGSIVAARCSLSILEFFADVTGTELIVLAAIISMMVLSGVFTSSSGKRPENRSTNEYCRSRGW